jgi:HK97 family phage portal protein
MALTWKTIKARVSGAVKALRGRDDLQPVDQVARGGNWLTIFDHRPGAWQQHDDGLTEADQGTVMTTAVVYACIRLLAWDIAKLPVVIKRLTAGIWSLADHQVLGLLLRKPNYYQTWIDFIQSWLYSYLITGNAYIVKVRDAGRFSQLIVLDPCKVQPMVSPTTGAIWYRVGEDPLTPVTEDDTLIAAADIIHHRYMAWGHPLLGTSLLVRAQMASRMRQGILETNAGLTESNAVPPGILIAPPGLNDDQLKALETKWNNPAATGRTRVVDAAFTFQSLQAKFIDSQAKEFAEIGGIDVCVACGVPPWKVGLGERPSGELEALNIMYYQDALQLPIEHIEQLLDTGLEVEKDVYICIEREELFLLDSKSRATVDAILIKGIGTPNEIRRKWNLPPVTGGDSVYMQQQNYSLEALSKRDSAAPAPASAGPPSGGTPGGKPETDEDDEEADDTPAATRTPLLPWAGVWDASGEYPSSCYVTHKGSLWVASGHGGVIVAGQEPGASAVWSLAAKGGRGSALPGTEK